MDGFLSDPGVKRIHLKVKVAVEDKEGNDEADAEADFGMNMHSPGLPAVADWFAARHGAYQKLVARIQILIVRMLQAEKEELEKMK